MSTFVTIIGNVTGDPALRFTQSGSAVCGFTVAVNERVKDGDQWKDGEPTFYECTAWKQVGENVAESVVKGSRVIVSGRLKARSYEAKDGSKRTVFDVQCDEVGLSLRYATAQAKKTERTKAAAPAAGDPWANDPWAQQPEVAPF